ncbi:hypothetical protein [Streptomyces sp. SPB162]|uniref:hypothetical protein n=1 Tax=Streptomyces sp. SPB162 TaxID=2940560 RepID=UPI0024053193|nr:hypothetical protein [Streptomyces sp. SPB162]MDF9815749.1 hypothetical protein [Streptomyces sp. SPB162]
MTEAYSDWDFGLSELSKRFDERWVLEVTAREAVASVAARADGMAARAILEDATRLLTSSLPAWAVTAVWQGATGRQHDLERLEVDGRHWLSEVAEVCVEQLRANDPAYRSVTPKPAPDTRAGAVLDELLLAGPALRAAAMGRTYREVAGLVSALDMVVTQVSPDLGFRLFLRAMCEYWVPISQAQYDRYEALGEHFGFGEFHVDDVRFLTTLRTE